MADFHQKLTIQTTIHAFTSKPLQDAAVSLFTCLGYKSDRTVPVDSVDAFCQQFDPSGLLAHPRAQKSNWKSINLLFQLTDEELSHNARRRIGANHTDWSFQHFKSVQGTGITLKEAKTEVQKAEDYLNGHSLDEAAICLRRAADDSAKDVVGNNSPFCTKELGCTARRKTRRLALPSTPK